MWVKRINGIESRVTRGWRVIRADDELSFAQPPLQDLMVRGDVPEYACLCSHSGHRMLMG